MKNKEYIMIGTNTITKDIFRKVLRPLNNYSFIPNGGFWASEYIDDEKISQWFQYLLNNTEIIEKKDINSAVIFTLKNNTKLLIINNYYQILELAKKYPSYHHILGYNDEITERTTSIDFEKLSKHYDCVYIDYKNIQNENKTNVFREWDINTLLLFNLDCIKEYKQVEITYIKEEPYYTHID